MPNVMADLPNIGGALCSRRNVWLTPTTRVPYINADTTRNPLKLAGVLQTCQQISAVSGPKFTILCDHEEKILLFNQFFFQLSIRALVAKVHPDKFCSDGAQMANFCVIFASCIFTFSATLVQHISDLHSKFALRPYHVWKYGRHPVCDG